MKKAKAIHYSKAEIPGVMKELLALIGKAKGKEKASYMEAAEFLKVSPGSVANWTYGSTVPGKTVIEAVKLAEKNIKTTPDLDEQMAKVSLMSCETVEREWALRIGSKSRG